MYYYTVSKVGTGTESDPFRPDLPIDTSYVSNESADGTQFLVATPTKISGLSEIIDLQSECATLGISYADVLTWNVGGG